MTTDMPTRGVRGRIVLAGEIESQEMDRQVIATGTAYDAIGEVAVSPARTPIEIVVLSASLAGDDPRTCAEAFRRLDLSLRVVVMEPTEADPGWMAEARSAFDACLPQPLTADAVRRVIEGDPRVEDEPVAESVPPRLAPAPFPMRLASTTDDEAPSESTGETLGDTDLVEALLHNPAGLRTTALKLVIQHTGWHDLELAESGPPPPGRTTVEVRFGGRVAGVLHTAMADPVALTPWAGWLARWLALDRAQHDLRRLAYTDDLTGAWNRRFMRVFLDDAIAEAGRLRRQLTVMVFDIDHFKHFNDEFGHDAGDEILRETVRMLRSVIRESDRVCRIGGDEFAVIFADMSPPREPGSTHPETVALIANRFQKQIASMRFPKLSHAAPGALTISGGLASFPWDGQDAETLLHVADQRALQSKRTGKDAITIGPRP